MPPIPRTLLSAFLLASSLAMTGCEREESIVTYTAPKEPIRPVASSVAHAPESATPSWTLPKDWTVAAEPGSMRFATINVPPDLQLAVAPLPPQELAPNINRWERQVGLPPTPADQINSVVRHMDGDHGTHFDVVDLTGKKPDGTPHRMFAALLNRGGGSWSFKLEGAPEKLTPHKETFEAFLKSIRFEGAAEETAHDHSKPAAPTPAPSAGGSSALSEVSSLPPGWREDPNPRPPMREKTYLVENTQPPTEVVISKFSMKFDLPMNLARWRTQVGLPAATEAEMARYVPRSMQVGGHEAKVLDVVGPNLRQIVVMANVNGELWFSKILGPLETVNRHQAFFEAFTQSLRFEPGR